MSPKIVNVASIPQRSPFRYPGGKTWLVPYIRSWLRSLPKKPPLFAEPFAGGGIVSMTVGFESLADHVAMVELDEDITAVWQAILGKDAEWLAKQIMEFDLTIENVRAELAKTSRTVRQMAFNTILKNRTFHGGIMAHGSGMLKHGESGKGIKSRWYPKTLHDRIMAIADYKDRFDFQAGDGIEFIVEHSKRKDAVFFIDPPYTAGGKGKRAGRRLYKHCELDHDALFNAAGNAKGDFLMTYDNDPEVLAMAKERAFDTEVVPMKNTHHAEMVELLIGRDLGWAREMIKPKTAFLPGF